MKLIYCLNCADIFSPGIETPKTCNCGYAIGFWRNPKTGTLEVASRGGESMIRCLGVNNDWLDVAQSLGNEDLLHKHWNERTSERADGYLFKTRNCPIIMFRPDERQVFYCSELCYMMPWGNIPPMSREDAKAKDTQIKASLSNLPTAKASSPKPRTKENLPSEESITEHK